MENIQKELDRELSKSVDKLSQIVKEYDNGSLEKFWLGYKIGIEKALEIYSKAKSKDL